MAEHVYLLTLILPLGTILSVFGMKYASAAVQAWAVKASDQDYRALAEQAMTAQQENAATLASMKDDLAKLSASMTSVETILKQVG